MAQKVQVILVDDLDGGEAEETVSFSLDGIAYEIDLSGGNAAQMRDSLSQYVGAARRVGGRSSARPRRASGASGGSRRGNGGGTTAEIREWARSNGYTVNDRGRIPGNVLEAYEKAHA